MADKRIWIKKYDYLPGVGNLYLVADFKKIFDASHLIIHEIVINAEALEKDTFTHQAYKYDLSQHLGRDIPLDMIAHSLLERHKNVFYTQLIADNESAGNLRSLKEADSGEKLLLELQFTSIFKDLKVSILKESRSDTFSKMLTGMNHLPLQVTNDGSSLRRAKLAATGF